jgi:hypothetical protein
MSRLHDRASQGHLLAHYTLVPFDQGWRADNACDARLGLRLSHAKDSLPQTQFSASRSRQGRPSNGTTIVNGWAESLSPPGSSLVHPPRLTRSTCNAACSLIWKSKFPRLQGGKGGVHYSLAPPKNSVVTWGGAAGRRRLVITSDILAKRDAAGPP